MIRRYIDGVTPIEVGMFVNCEGLMRNTLAGKARRVVSVTDKQINTIVCGREDEGVQKKLKRLIQFVCDTEEEAVAMNEASVEAMKKAFTMEDNLREQISKMMRDNAQRVIDRFPANLES